MYGVFPEHKYIHKTMKELMPNKRIHTTVFGHGKTQNEFNLKMKKLTKNELKVIVDTLYLLFGSNTLNDKFS